MHFEIVRGNSFTFRTCQNRFAKYRFTAHIVPARDHYLVFLGWVQVPQYCFAFVSRRRCVPFRRHQTRVSAPASVSIYFTLIIRTNELMSNNRRRNVKNILYVFQVRAQDGVPPETRSNGIYIFVKLSLVKLKSIYIDREREGEMAPLTLPYGRS